MSVCPRKRKLKTITERISEAKSKLEVLKVGPKNTSLDAFRIETAESVESFLNGYPSLTEEEMTKLELIIEKLFVPTTPTSIN